VQLVQKIVYMNLLLACILQSVSLHSSCGSRMLHWEYSAAHLPQEIS
jgi:hypothetical protein